MVLVDAGPATAGAPGALHRWLLPGATVLAVTGVLLYLSAELHFALPDLARFVLVALLLVLPPGWLLVSSTALPNSPLLARLGLALLVGYPATLAAYFALAVLRLEAAYPFLLALAALGGGALWLRRAPPGALRRLPAQLVQQADWGAVFAGAIVLAACAPWMGYLAPAADGGFLFRGYHDNLVHAAYVQEMLRGVPPAQLPMAAGEVFPKYHLLHNVFVMLAARYGALDPLQSYFTLAPIALHSLLVSGLCLTVGAVTGQRPLGWLTAGAVYVFGPIVEEALARTFAFGAPSVAYLRVNGPSLGGLIVLCAAVACLALFDRARREGRSARDEAPLLYLAGLAAGSLYLFKAEFFVLFFPAFLLGLGLIGLRDRLAQAWAGAGVALLVFAFFHFAWPAPSWARLVVQPGVFAEARLIGVQGLLEAQRFAYQWMQAYLAAGRPPWPVWTLLTLVIGWRFIQLSPILPAYLYNRLRNYRSLGLWESVVALQFPLWLALAFGVDAAELTGPPRGLLATVAAILLSFEALALNGVLLGWFVARRLHSARARAWGSAAVLALLVLAAPGALFVGRLRTAEGIPLSRAEMAAFRYLAQSTPIEAVVVQDRYSGPVVSAFSGRRVVIERFGERYPGRKEAVDTLYTTTDPAAADAILRRYHVDYLIEYSEAPLQFDKGALRAVFSEGDVTIYQVRQP